MKKKSVILSVLCVCAVSVILSMTVNNIVCADSTQRNAQTGSISDSGDTRAWEGDYPFAPYSASTDRQYTTTGYEWYTTAEPVGEIFTTEESTTEYMTEESPTTEEPTTEEPTTEEPTTEEPTTEEPTTEDDSYKEQSGDTDGDGEITAADARTVLRVCVKAGFISNEIYSYCEVDGDGEITASDARTVLRVAVKLEEKSVLRKFVPYMYDFGRYFYNRESGVSETMYEGESMTVQGISARTTQNPVWKASNPQVVSISADGKITALKKGYSCVYTQVNDEYFYYDITVKNELQRKIESLKSKYPDGYYWNNHTPCAQYPNVSEIPCDDHIEGKYAYCKGQCAGFAYLISSEVFGNSEAKYGLQLEDIRIGDYVRLLPSHSVIITDIVREGDIIGYNFYSETHERAGSDYYEVVHCNWHWCCDINWNDMISITEIDPKQSFTRY